MKKLQMDKQTFGLKVLTEPLTFYDFSLLQVAQFLKKWRPKHPLRERTRRMIEDFLGTRGKKYADITINVVRIERNKARKRKGLK